MSSKKFCCIALAFVLAACFVSTQAFASSIAKKELADLASDAEVIALAQVTKVDKKSEEADTVTIKIAAVIKGELKSNEIELTLTPRGVKDFDPALKAGDTGVFFLKDVDGKSAKLAYFGSVAAFAKQNFVADKKLYEPVKDFVNVKIETSMGDIVLELNRKKAPITVDNFLNYTKAGTYNATIFHRVMKGFMIQGGGFNENMIKKPNKKPIKNESNNGLKNKRGTIAMARTNDPDSATNQFFINHKDNVSLDFDGPRPPGYAVFGKVIKGMDVVDAIANVKTTSKAMYQNVPAETVMIKKVSLIESK